MSTSFAVRSVVPLVAAALAPFATSASPQDATKSPKDPDAKQIEAAEEAFAGQPAEAQAAIAAEIVARVNASKEGELAKLFALRDRAVKELKLTPARPATAYDPKEYARGLVTRTNADPDSVEVSEAHGLFKTAENPVGPYYGAHVVWDFGHDEAADYGALDPTKVLFNGVHGYPPDADVLVAWLTKRFDFDTSTNAVAQYFDHLYADRNGKVFPDVTLYEAWASGQKIEMPDVDAIAYARLVLKDTSYVTPIPPDKANKLYKKIEDGFLAWFQYRTWIEAAANLYVNPDTPLRAAHAPLRRRLLYTFVKCDGDVDKVAKTLADSKGRAKYVETTDAAIKADPDADAKIGKFVAARQAQQWTVARATYAVLRDHSMLPKE
jgi:hypothetical protein